jgi:two-component system sensor histidine kinase KdpD
MAIGIAAFFAATVAIAWLETYAGVPNASSVYLAAVVVIALVAGTPGAIVASVAAFLLYDFLFTQPYLTLSITDPAELLSVVLLLFVGIVVGQLAALQRARAEDARANAREARALFQVSRTLATRPSTLSVLPAIARILRESTQMERVWIALERDGPEHTAADTGEGVVPIASLRHVLQRTPGDAPAQWARVHVAAQCGRHATALEVYRVRIEAASKALGSIWAGRNRGLGLPDRTETRLLSAAADQIGQAISQDAMAADAQAAEVARRSDALKTALLQSVSHDLRTPLATIRAAAGSLRRESGLDPNERMESADAIDREVEYLNRMVTNLLDLSRIEAGVLRPEPDVFELQEIVSDAVKRARPRLAGRQLELRLSGPPVEADPTFVDEALANVIDNVAKYTPPDAAVRIESHVNGEAAFVTLTIEDGGPGVADDELRRLFDKFYRVPGSSRSSRSGTGIGLAVVRGLIEATGGRATARRSELGGLAVDFDLPAADLARHAPPPP